MKRQIDFSFMYDKINHILITLLAQSFQKIAWEWRGIRRNQSFEKSRV